ncbi:MAG: 50S ribosomal protein L6 [Candidatus Bathyarchaeota archaeon]|nr:MAG: 50S ribosomal protein L6 [Candidatus Bathyarchaeota archaeon]
MRLFKVEKTVEIPEEVNVEIDGRVVTISGEKGTLTRDFSHAPISIQKEGSRIIVGMDWPRKKEAATAGTISSHIKNMILGTTKGFTYKLKIVFSHFPISVKVQEGEVLIENFTGERGQRRAKIVGETKVLVKTEDVIAQGINLEDVSQTAANIEQATKVKIKDPRVFLDGIYVYERLEGLES